MLGGEGSPTEGRKIGTVSGSEQQTSPGKCYANLRGNSAGKKSHLPSPPAGGRFGEQGSSVIARAELNGQLELSTSSTALAWISRCLHNYETTNRKGASSLSKGA